jgi:ATP synthase protein I
MLGFWRFERQNKCSDLPFEGDKTMARQDSKRDRLDTLEKKLSASRQRHQPDDNHGRANANMLGLAWRLTIEMLVGIGVGGFIGWWIDKVLGTEPIFMLLLLVLGMGAGLMNSVRTVAEMRRKQDELDAARKTSAAAENEE